MAKGRKLVLHPVGSELPPIRADIFVEDPMTARQGGRDAGIHTIELVGEAYLGAGPVSGRVEVVGKDTAEVKFAPVPVRAAGDGFVVGRRAPEANHSFHRVNCWALVTRVLNLLEDPQVLGRRIPWAFDGARIRVNAHAGYEENAYYDRAAGGLEFFYFDDPAGQRIYTCLSHDIVTHELGHAVLDGLKPFYAGYPSPEEAGFHEYFGDAVGMTSALSMAPVVRAVARRSPEKLGGDNLVAKIGREVGLALAGKRKHDYTRQADNDKTMIDLRGSFSEHEYSEVLTGAFYDLLRVMYDQEMARRRETRRRVPLADRTAALTRAARRTSGIMLRGVDYCPPAGLEFADYARAVVRSDEVAYPIDARGYRAAIRRIFRRRRIVRRLSDLDSAASRIWNCDLRSYDVDVIGSSRTDAAEFLDRNRELLAIPRDVNFWVSNLYRTHKLCAGGFFPPRELVVEFVWRATVDRHPMYCGGTLVFDHCGNVIYYVLKGNTLERRRRLRAYWKHQEDVEGGGDAAAFAAHRRRRSCFRGPLD